MQRVTSREFQRNFGRFQDEALKSPLSIARNGRDRLVVLSIEEYERLKRRDRRALLVEELSDAEIEAIRRAEPPPEAETVEAMEAARPGELVTVGSVDELMADLKGDD